MRRRGLIGLLALMPPLAGCFDFSSLGNGARNDAGLGDQGGLLDLAAGADGSRPSAIRYVEGDSQTAVAASSLKITLPNAQQSNLLVGWFLQYDVSGQVAVSDDVNGPWTRGPSMAPYGSAAGHGDAALYYIINTATKAVTVTAKVGGATYIQATVAEYAGIRLELPLDQFAVAKGMSAKAVAGPTGALNAAGELVYAAHSNGAALLGNVTADSAFTLRSSNGDSSEEDAIAASTAGQTASFTFPSATDWNMVVATFIPAAPL